MTVVAGNPTVVYDYQLKLEEKYSAPMPWVGMYVAAASLVCTLAMAADIFHGIRHNKLWFPCKYFTLNAASLTVIAIAMKLPVDLNNPMPRDVDQATKISSSAFMCIMMANFMPSLGSMNSRELLLNIVALGILVITIIVNVSIQLSTGLIYDYMFIFYLFFMLCLLTLITSSALMIPISKKILRYKYNEMLKIAFTEESDPTRSLSTVEKLISDVSKYWIMTETSNPQFVMACSPTCSASGAICFFVLIFLVLRYLPYSYSGNRNPTRQEGESDYKWSVFPITIVQYIGVLVGTIAPFFRLFRAFSFKLSFNHSKTYLKVCHAEKYWTETLVNWKCSRVPLQIGGLKCQKAIHEFKNLIVSSTIRIQIFIVILSKITQLIFIVILSNIIQFFIVIFIIPITMFDNCWYCCTLWVRKLMASVCASRCQEGVESEHHDSAMPDLSRYVLQLEDEVELANRTLTRISEAVLHLIKEADKKHPRNLMRLLEKSKGYEGVAKFDNNQVPPLYSSQLPNSWSLVVATLTCIVIALRAGKVATGDCLLSGINEGLQLVRLIEESLDPNEEISVNVRKAASFVWLQVEIYNKWMDEDLKDQAHEGKTPNEILRWLSDKAQKILMECKKSIYLGPADSSFQKIVAANSMYRISQSILLNHEGREGQPGEMLLDELSIMIADILSACLSNIQRIIANKCIATDIEKREANVKTAAQLVGQTKEIRKFLQQRELPCLEPNKLGYIDEWNAFLNPSSSRETVSSNSSQLLSISVE